MIESIRNAYFRYCEVMGAQPEALVMHPDDWQYQGWYMGMRVILVPGQVRGSALILNAHDFEEFKKSGRPFEYGRNPGEN